MRIEYLMSSICLASILSLGCVLNDGSVKKLSDRASGKLFSEEPIELSQEEIKARQDTLRSLTRHSDAAEKTDSTSVFEGEVIGKVYISRLNTIKVTVAVSKVVYGLKSVTMLLDVHTPLNKNGIEFEVGRKCRVGAVQKGPEYWTWIWLGTYEL